MGTKSQEIRLVVSFDVRQVAKKRKNHSNHAPSLSCVAGAVVKHFEDFHEDQFDFHSYCVRKVTLRAYIDVLRYEDHLWGEPYYARAAEGIIGIYLHLFDNPSITAGEDEPDYSKMTAAQKKKAKAIARKKKKAAEKKAEEEEEQRSKEQEANENGKKKDHQEPIIKDPDLDGKELLKKDPLQEAKNYSATLAKHSPKRLSTWILQYDVSIRRGKALLAMQVRRAGLIVLPLVLHVCTSHSFLVLFLITGFIQSSRNRCTKQRSLSSHCGLCVKGRLIGNGPTGCPRSDNERIACVARWCIIGRLCARSIQTDEARSSCIS